MNQDLQQKWNRLISKFSKNENLNQQLWTEIESHYSKDNRAYHNLNHLRCIFQEMDHHQSDIQNPDLLQFSIWYHDIIYNAMRKDNELKSAEKAKEVLTQLGLEQSDIKQCYQQIMLTKTHQLTEEHSLDEKFLIDFDLEVLSRDWEDYKVYTQQVRKEYWMYPKLLYNKGRKAALESFLDREQIYYTNPYREKEQKAIGNIKQEMEDLLG